MCGRTCCTLSPDLLPLACSSVTKGHKPPAWADAKGKGKGAGGAGSSPGKGGKKGGYSPSTNLMPTAQSPVLCMGKQMESKDDMVLKTMLWGLVPVWFNGEDPTKTHLSTNNARIEGVTDSKVYKPSINGNRRCVVVCDGFYEWHKVEGKGKQPYLVYMSQKGGKKIEDMGKCTNSDYAEKGGWTGPRPLYMAGLYSVWEPKTKGNKQDPVYSYTVITRSSDGSELSWLHDRMPAILPDAAAVQKWLDPEIEGADAVKLLKPLKKGELSWHPVSRDVGNTRNQGDELPEPVELGKDGKPKDTKSASASVMKNWLGGGGKKDKEGGKSPAKSPQKRKAVADKAKGSPAKKTK